ISERDAAALARADEAARADELLVERADALVDSDPLRAVALLKQLRPASSSWVQAVGTFDSALSRGVARGKVAHVAGRGTSLGVSPDGRSVISGSDDGKLILHDPTLTKPSRLIATLDKQPDEIVWTDASSLIVVAGLRAFRVRLDGAITPLDTGGRVSAVVESTSRQLAVISKENGLRVLPADGGTPIRVVPEAREAVRVATGWVWTLADAVVYAADGAQPITLGQYPNLPIAVATDRDRRRFAVGFFRGPVIEWELRPDGPVVRGEWTVPAIVQVSYIGPGLLALGDRRQQWLTPKREPVDASLLDTVLVRTTTATCGFASGLGGGILAICSYGTHRIGTLADRISGLVLADGHLVAATRTGTLLSWKLDRLLPRRVPAPAGSSPLALGGGRIWMTSRSGLIAVEIATGVITQLGEPGNALPCFGRDHAVLASMTGSTSRITSIHATTLERMVIAEGVTNYACWADQERIIVVKGASTLEVIDLRKPGPPVATVSSAEMPFSVMARGHWMALAMKGDRIERIDLDTQARIELRVADARQVVVDERGRLAIRARDRVVLWDNGKLSEVPIAGIGPVHVNPAGLVVISGDQSLTVIDDHGQTRSFATAREISVSNEQPFVAWSENHGVTVIDLGTGLMRRIAGDVNQVGLSPDATQLWGNAGDTILVWSLTQPDDPQSLRGLLDRETNAIVQRGSTKVELPEP
nr:hypothetical protein [Deltaproteobacteria bacterium]